MKLGHILWGISAAACATAFNSRGVDYPGLYFSDGKFEITMFNDLHLGDAGLQDGIQKGVWSDNLTIDVMNKVLNYESATDLAVLNGDLTSCEWVAEKDSYSLLNKAMSPFLTRKLPFATTFGNHDWSASCNTRWMSEHIWRTANDPKYGGQLTFTTSSVDGDPNTVGTSNYYIPLYSKINGKQVLKMILWFFDSKGGFAYTGNVDNKQPTEGYVHPDVVNWFKQTREQLKSNHGGKPIPSLVFVHIPIAITEHYVQAGLRSATAFPGIQYAEDLGTQDDKGTAFMQTLVDTEDVLGVFSGHDHNNDWCMKWTKTPEPVPENWPPAANGYGLNMCFGRHTGYGGYSEVMRGGRHVVIYEDALGGDNSIETWNRLENGEISGRVMLNSTYGTDEYPRVKVKFSNGTVIDDIVVGRSNDDGPSTTTRRPHSFSTRKKSSTVTKPTKTTASAEVTKPTTSFKHSKTTVISKIAKATTTSSVTKMRTTTKVTSKPKSTSGGRQHTPRGE